MAPLRALLPFTVALAAVTPAAAADPSFDKAGVAFVAKYCVSCHGAAKPKADLSLHAATTDAAVLKDRKVWQSAADAVRGGDMPPKGKPQPTAAESEAFVQLVGGLFDRADRLAKPDPGRVTMRRLNRAEYNNTVRDLCYVDFTPADDFPADDVGHGFDNIGDVLSLPPVLMERYLAAAEGVMDRAVVVVPPKPVTRWHAAEHTEPAAANVPLRNKWRVVSGKPGAPGVESGPINVPCQGPADGEYAFRTRVYAETAGARPVKVALLAACDAAAPGVATDAEADALSGAGVKGLRPFKVLRIVEVKGRTEKAAESFEVALPAGLGVRRVAVALVKPAAGEPPATLFVRNLEFDGPLGYRPASHRKLLACDGSKPKAAQTREVLARFASRAFRRPATADEVGRLAKLAEAAVAKGGSWEAGVQLAMTAVLVSPKFLFRVELDDRPAGPDARPLDDFQLASRLSYFLWSSMPDDELTALAAKKQLTPNLEAQVKRMLADPKANALVDNFVMQWLQLGRLNLVQPDGTKFKAFDDQLRKSMRRETELFFGAVIKEDRSVLDVLDAPFTFVDERLARHYGLADTAGNKLYEKATRTKGKPIPRGGEFVRVDVSGTDRGGVLTQASVLTVTSNPTRTSPVKRGKWVLEQLLGTPPPPPPPDVPELEKDGKARTGSLRKRMEQHRANVACANCHAKMDPLGFGLENFDAVGAYRQKDDDVPIDPSGELPGGLKFSGPAGLKVILKGKKDLFARCLAEKMLTYATGRGLDTYDKRAVDKITQQLAANDFRFSSLVVGIVTSDPFRLRRGKD